MCSTFRIRTLGMMSRCQKSIVLWWLLGLMKTRCTASPKHYRYVSFGIVLFFPFCFVAGSGANPRFYTINMFIQTWLLGYELTDTVMLFTKEALYFLSSKKKIEFLKPVESPKDKTGDDPAVELLVRDRVSYLTIMPAEKQ